jgi:hypothetical protein
VNAVSASAFTITGNISFWHIWHENISSLIYSILKDDTDWMLISDSINMVGGGQMSNRHLFDGDCRFMWQADFLK